MLVHNVYFALHDASEPSRQKLLSACKQYLQSHPGIVSFSCGTLAAELRRPVNDRDFDVSLHIVFATQADHDRYQEHPLHVQFVQENKPTWKKVRVFDSLVD
jgi:hypothetical protein